MVQAATACALFLLAACGGQGPSSASKTTSPGAPPAAASTPTRRPAAAAALGATTAPSSHAQFRAAGFNCVDCHPCGGITTGHGPEWMVATSPAFHALAANRNLADCQTCHGVNLDGAGGSTVVGCQKCHGDTWRTSCTMCHGGAANPSGAPPKATFGNAADPVRVGAHTAHVGGSATAQAYGCEVCHVVPADALSAGHVDGTFATVKFAGLAIQGGLAPAWDRASPTCGGTYCHGGFKNGNSQNAPDWTKVGQHQAACGTCHAVPPGGTHPSVPADVTGCVMCHEGAIDAAGKLLPAPAGKHLDGAIQVSSNHPPEWMAPVSPDFHATSANRGLGACQACHGQDLSGGFTGISCAKCHGATWATTCTMCHGGSHEPSGAPPKATWGQTADPVRVGAHTAHVKATASADALDCDVCHVKPADAFAAGHIDGAFATVQLSGLAVQGGVTPPAWDRASPTCASTYCHGNFPNGKAQNLPDWTKVGEGQASCGTCHGVPPGGTHPVVAADLAGCAVCHPDSVDGAGNVRPTHLGGKHLDGQVDFKASHDASWMAWGQPTHHAVSANQSLTACQVCHGADLAGGFTGVSCAQCHGASWRTSCTMCHGGTENATGAPPRATYLNTGDAIRVGAHSVHVNGRGASPAVPCEVCHVVPTDALSPGHLDGPIATVTFGGLAKGGGLDPVFDRGTATCASTYCHGGTLKGGTNTKPDWRGGQGEVACGTCHGVPPPAPHPAGATTTADCATCHPRSVNTAGEIMPGGLHLDGKVDAEKVHDAEWMNQASTTFHAYAANRGLEGCRSCHGQDLSGGIAAVSCAQCHGAGWASKCTMCHGGTQNQTGAPPKPRWGSQDPLAVGAHTAHVAGSARAQAYGCAACHPTPADAYSAGHLGNGPAQVNLGLGWNRATGTCASATCHGTAAMGGSSHTPVWTSKGTAACGTCHGLPPPGTTHANVPADLGGCAMCHRDSVDVTGAVKLAPLGLHLDGKVDHNEAHDAAWRDQASPGFHAFAANQSLTGCEVCHGPALDGGTAGVACAQCHTAAWKTDCTMCHGTPGVSAAPPRTTWGNAADQTLRAGAHAAHLGGGLFAQSFGCAVCHLVPADALAPGHVGGLAADVSFSGLAAQGVVPVPAWDRTSPTCASTYCHGNFRGGSSDNAPNWTLTGQGQGTCGTCHGLPPAAPHPQNPSCGNCHDGYTRTSVNLTTHVDGAVEVLPLTCTSCHGSALNAAPPFGTRGETLTSDAAVGAHQAHLSGGTLGPAVACTDCHLVPTSMTHADGKVDVAFSPRAYTNGGQPTWDAGSLTCAGTYCHGATLRGGGANTAPLWTGGPGQVACGACHGTPPPQPHPHTAICDNCHPGYTLTSVNLATHMNGVIDAVELTCSSCHGDDTRVLTMGADPNAIAAPPFGSRGETATTSVSVGQHQAHVNGGHELALPSKCRYCHVVPTNTDHWNGVSQVTFGSLATMGGAQPTFDEATGTCANTYCHGATLGRGGTDHNPRWVNPDPVTCTSCHGVPPPLPHPQDSDCIRCHPGYTSTSVRKWTHVNGISDFPSGCNSCHDDPPNTGAHYEHLHERITCDRCHQGYTSTSENPALHRNAKQDVTLSGWNASTRTCNNIGCHGSEYWGRNGTAARTSCNQCHGVPPDSGEHREHSEYACSRCHGTGYSKTTTGPTHMSGVVDVPFAFYDRATLTCGRGTGSCHDTQRWGARGKVTANCGNCHGFPPPLPHPQQSACQSCHPSMLANGTLTSTHNDGTLDISGQGCQACHGFPPTATRAGGTHPSDANCYGCHPTTVNAQNQIVPDGTHNDGAVQVGGTGVGTYGCQTCHGDQARTIDATMDRNAKAAPPLGTRGETEPTTRAVGAHLAHLTPVAGGLARPAACAECHVVPTAMDHANGVVVNTFGGRAVLQDAAPTFQLSDFTCAGTYCHGATLGAGGSNHTPAWNGGPAEAACGTCHGSPPPDPHPQSTTCGGCHDGYTSASVNVATHVDGTLQISAMACNSCHGSAQSAAPPLGTHGETATTTLAVGAHQQHLAASVLSSPIACSECHVPPTSMSHKDGTAQVTFGALATTGGAAPAWDRATASCSASYCHGQFTGGNTFNAPVWTVVNGTQAACGTCHGAPPPPPHDPSTDCNACHPGYTIGSVDLTQHLNGRVDVTMSCTSCHGDGARVALSGADANVKAAPPADSTGATAVTARGVGAHLGHVNQATFAAAPVACSECHFGAVPPAGDTSHVNGAVAFAFGPLAKNASWGGVTPSPTWNGTSCANTYCHGAFKNGANATIAWAQDVTLSCTSCHGNPPGGGHTANTACGSCHAGYTNTSVNKATHVNGALDVVAMTCTSCHGKAGQTATAASPLNAAPPVDAAGLTTGAQVGAHQKHLTGGTFATAMSCQTCHPTVATYTTTHSNGVSNVAFTGAANANLQKGTWKPGTGAAAGTCASTWCHGAVVSRGTSAGGTNLTPAWSQTITSCAACHGAPPSTGRHTSISSHRVTCSYCHGGTYTSTLADKTRHVNGTVEVNGPRIRTWTASSRSCSPTCHGSATW